MKTRPASRHAYVKAEVVTALAHQVRAIRLQRGWTQAQLAKQLGTTQAVVSRLEDPSYGRITLSTLFDLAKVFDTGLEVKFVSTVSMLQRTFVPDAQAREVPSFAEEEDLVCFYSPKETSAVLFRAQEPVFKSSVSAHVSTFAHNLTILPSTFQTPPIEVNLGRSAINV
ncbi:helix-turn-helix transcriptional regulator [Variovorax soli]|uniref:helix-turn-helix transcriptional regulator n=1 Tax=Variovorax soli TaxID=376815 RepID=UPI00137B12DD|nr:helix-turn-helix transcriptional regulator [Variovorax soli]